MRNLARLACFGATLALVLGLTGDVRAGKPDKPAGKPGSDEPKTQACTLTGDAEGGGVVGIDAKSYGNLTLIVIAGEPEPTALEAVFDGVGLGPFSGKGRVLKRQGRLDFWFGVEEPECEPAEWGDVPGPGSGICRYRLILLNGVYARKADRVEFTVTGGADASLYDNWLLPGDPLMLSGTANLVVQFED